jgi:hypothetical protein
LFELHLEQEQAKCQKACELREKLPSPQSIDKKRVAAEQGRGEGFAGGESFALG